MIGSDTSYKCSICLCSPFVRMAVIDPCFHSFCFLCIQNWIQIGSSCPLCKSNIAFILTDLDSATLFSKISIEEVRCGISENDMLSRRRFVYSHKLYASFDTLGWSKDKFVGRPKDPAYYSTQNGKKELIRIECWLRREFEVLLGDPNCELLIALVVSIIQKHLHSTVNLTRDLASFLKDYVHHFVHEFEFFRLIPSFYQSLDAYDALPLYSFPESQNSISTGLNSTYQEVEQACENEITESEISGFAELIK